MQATGSRLGGSGNLVEEWKRKYCIAEVRRKALELRSLNKIMQSCAGVSECSCQSVSVVAGLKQKFKRKHILEGFRF